MTRLKIDLKCLICYRVKTLTRYPQGDQIKESNSRGHMLHVYIIRAQNFFIFFFFFTVHCVYLVFLWFYF
jgi:hypothetical protein